MGIVGMTRGITADAVHAAIAEYGLSPWRRKRCGELSLGMRQRVGLALAMLGDPSAFVLDEPTIGLDTEALRWLRGLLRERAARGRAVLLSSHVMSEVHDLADELLIIVGGRIVWSSTMEGFMKTHARQQTLVGGPDIAAVRSSLERSGAAVFEVPEGLLVTGLPREAVGRAAYLAGCEITELRSCLTSLEDVYLDFVAAAEARAQ